MPYVVMVHNNFHRGEVEHAHRAGEFTEASAALQCCRSIVDDYLMSAFKPGMSSTALWDSYASFGEDPVILCIDVPEVRFSAWDYAQVRCSQLARSKLSPLEKVALSVRPEILNTWVHDAIESYRDAAVLLGRDADLGRLTTAKEGALYTELLKPCYDALVRRYADEVTDGRQGVLFASDPASALQRQWSRFAVGYMRRRGSAQRARWIIQATVGLCGAIDRPTAANFLFGHVLDAPLPDK